MTTKTKAICLSMVLLSCAASYGMDQEEKYNSVNEIKTMLRMKNNPKTARFIYNNFIELNENMSDSEQREKLSEKTQEFLSLAKKLSKKEMTNYIQKNLSTPEYLAEYLQQEVEYENEVHQEIEHYKA